MSSGNAFRDNANDATSELSEALKRAKEKTPAKLPAAGQDAGTPEQHQLASRQAGIWHRTAHEDTALEVDLLILDYLVYQTTSTALAGRTTGAGDVTVRLSLDNNLAMMDSFVQIFSTKYPSFQADVELRFRLMLLKFTTAFTQRLTRNATTPTTAALQILRGQNQIRARQWIGSENRIPSCAQDMSAFDSDLPLDLNTLEQNRAYVMRMLEAPEEDDAYDDAFYGTSTSLSLLDLLPVFMKIVAARNAISASNMSKQLMQTVGEFMLQACVEQYLVRGDSGSDAVDEAFAWGLDRSRTDRDAMEVDGEAQMRNHEDSDDEINAMFTADDDEETPSEVHGWAETKMAFMKQLVLPARQSSEAGLKDSLEAAAQRYPIADFNARIRGFLTALLASTSEPILFQLDKGCLDGYTADGTGKFLRECGLGGQWTEAFG